MVFWQKCGTFITHVVMNIVMCLTSGVAKASNYSIFSYEAMTDCIYFKCYTYVLDKWFLKQFK